MPQIPESRRDETSVRVQVEEVLDGQRRGGGVPRVEVAVVDGVLDVRPVAAAQLLPQHAVQQDAVHGGVRQASSGQQRGRQGGQQTVNDDPLVVQHPHQRLIVEEPDGGEVGVVVEEVLNVVGEEVAVDVRDEGDEVAALCGDCGRVDVVS